MFVQWQKWRSDLVPLGYIPDSEVKDELEGKKMFLQGLSKNGYPIMLVKGSNHFHSKDQPQFKISSDGGCISGSESDDFDWSIGWLEPHGSDFQSDDDLDDSFAVFVPCYGHGQEDPKVNSVDKFPGNIRNISDLYAGVWCTVRHYCGITKAGMPHYIVI